MTARAAWSVWQRRLQHGRPVVHKLSAGPPREKDGEECCLADARAAGRVGGEWKRVSRPAADRPDAAGRQMGDGPQDAGLGPADPLRTCRVRVSHRQMAGRSAETAAVTPLDRADSGGRRIVDGRWVAVVSWRRNVTNSYTGEARKKTDITFSKT